MAPRNPARRLGVISPTRGHPGPVQRKAHPMTLGTILLIILVLILIGALPSWGYSRSWGYGPSGVVGVLLVILLILVLMGRI